MSKNLIGEAFNRWLVIDFGEKTKDGHKTWLCECQCDKHTRRYVKEYSLISQKSKSCGCLQREKAKESKTKHGQCHTSLYNIWSEMKQRLTNEKCQHYKDYGGRGIKLYDSWVDFKNFYEWAVNNGYKEGLSIERKDVNGDYCPENCEWIELKHQQRNKRTSNKIKINGEEKCLAEWCQIYNMPYNTVRGRIKLLGWNPEKALTYPIKN